MEETQYTKHFGRNHRLPASALANFLTLRSQRETRSSVFERFALTTQSQSKTKNIYPHIFDVKYGGKFFIRTAGIEMNFFYYKQILASG
jgi:hypothetical protein